jgi:aldehyde dehydrogenase (NAD+)/succinate-semialdehyde dehydrogenase/glutarate-semialdehyde dehydrogenase
MKEKLHSYNPATKELVGTVEVTNINDIKTIVDNSKVAQKDWAKLSIDERIAYLKKAGELLNHKSQSLAVLLSKEMGKDINRSGGEVNGCANDIEYKANEVKNAIVTQEFKSYGLQTELQYNALGVCAVIAPWNYPMAMAHWVMIPALVAGNSVVYKPSEETPLIAQEYVNAFQSVLPKDVVQIIHGDEKQGKALVESDVNLIAFTGSKEVGEDIMKNASCGLKRLIMELGGKDPLIVLDDANINQAAQFAVASSFENAGQMCTSIERIYVDKKVSYEFEQKVVQIASQYKIGAWNEPNVNIGPIINDTQRDKIINQIDDAKQKGATVLLGGDEHPEGFITPTVLSNITDDMLIFQDETFGPVVAISYFEDVNDAIKRANSSEFALGASIFGQNDVDRLSQELDAGMLGINQGSGSIGDTPWVGAKKSGFGYHGSPDGHRQFTQPKVVTKSSK